MTLTANFHISEQELLLQLQQGDQKAFTHLYRRYKDPLGYRLFQLLKNDALAEEVLQDLFLKVWEHRANIDPQQPFRAYLYRIAANLSYNLMNRASKERAILEQIIEGSTELYRHIEEQLFQKENEALLHAAIERLPSQRKKIFIACKIEGKSYKEVADELRISPHTVNDHIQKAMQYLRMHIAASAHSYLALAVLLTESCYALTLA